MNTPSTLAAYAAALVVVFGAATGVGRLVGPVGAEPAAASTAGHAGGGHGAGGRRACRGRRRARRLASVGGLAVAADGYALHLERTTASPGTPFELGFTISGPDGEPVRDYSAPTTGSCTSSSCAAT